MKDFKHIKAITKPKTLEEKGIPTNPPTIEECLKVVKQLNEKPNPNATEVELKHKANLLYLLNRLNFWEDVPILLEFVKHEVELKTK